MLRVLLAALLVYSVNQIHFPTELGLRGLNVVNLLFLLAAAFAFGRAGPSTPAAARLKLPIIVFFSALVVGYLIAIVRAPHDLSDDNTYLKNALFYPLFYFLFFHAVGDLKTARWLIGLVLLVAVVAGLEAFHEALDYGIGAYVDSHRSSGPFGADYRSANRAGVFYAMFLPMLIAPAMFLRKRFTWRMLAFGGTIIMALGLLFTYSRQSYFIALVGLGLLALRRSFPLLILLGIASVIAIPFLPESVTQRVQETKQTGKLGEAEYDESTASRWEIWSGAAAMWGHHPFGIGINRFKGEIGNYSIYSNKDAHNFYVLTLAEAGIQGELALLFLILSLMRLAGWMRRSVVDDESRALAIGFSVCTVAMALGNIYGSPFLEGTVMADYWALCGLLERYMLLVAAQQAAQAASAPPPVPRPRPQIRIGTARSP